MKKTVFTLFLGLFLLGGTTVVNSKPNVSMHCVGTCIGTFCGDEYADIDTAIRQIEVTEDLCETLDRIADMVM